MPAIWHLIILFFCVTRQIQYCYWNYSMECVALHRKQLAGKRMCVRLCVCVVVKPEFNITIYICVLFYFYSVFIAQCLTWHNIYRVILSYTTIPNFLFLFFSFRLHFCNVLVSVFFNLKTILWNVTTEEERKKKKLLTHSSRLLNCEDSIPVVSIKSRYFILTHWLKMKIKSVNSFCLTLIR